MNLTQQIVLGTGIVVMILSELFLPWRYVDDMTSAERSAGYHFITSQPAVKSRDEMLKIYGGAHIVDSVFPQSVHVSVDKRRLFPQRLFILLITVGLLLFSKSSRSWKTMGILALCLALLPLAAWFLLAH